MPGKFLVMATWDNCPHLDQRTKDELWASIPPYQREARSKGIPSLGAGAIYPVPESDIVVPDFEIPPHWPRAYGLDVGWNRTAGIWGALNRDTDVLHLYSEHYRGEAEPVIHSEALKTRGAWIRGAIDPSSRGRGQIDGRRLLQMYRDLGLDLTEADNSVETGLYRVLTRMTSGRLKVFRSLQNWLGEFRLYRRDERGRVVKERDHAMDACVAPETPVITSDGVLPIRDLVGKSGKVLSRAGSWLSFVGARKTMENVRVVRVHFEDGSDVVCTPDHPFLTPTGWIPAIEMGGRCCYNGVSQSIHHRRLSFGAFHGLFHRLSSYFSAALTTCVESTFSGMVSGYIGVSGRYGTGALCLVDSTFTTRTTIDPTITLITSNLSPDQSTYRTTTRDEKHFLKRLLQRHRNGTVAKKAISGISNNTNEPRINSTSRLHSFASIVARRLKLKSRAIIDSAQTIAKPSPAVFLALTMKNALVWFAAEVSWSIATLKHRRVRSLAVVRSSSVTEAGTSDVYCLTVPAAHSFCLGNGAVVHNTRYLEMELLNICRTKPEPQKRQTDEDYYSGGGYSTGWMG